MAQFADIETWFDGQVTLSEIFETAELAKLWTA